MSVFAGDDRWDYVAGVADVDTGEPFALDTNVRIASISKTFTATAVLQLVDAGQLALTDVLEDFIPGIPNGDRITIQQLLAMTSGIYSYTDDPAVEAALLADPTMPFDLQTVIDIVLRHEPAFEPGADIAYCDTNYWFLGEIVEQVTGRPIHVVIGDLATTAGLTSTVYPAPDDFGLPDPHPMGYAPAADVLEPPLHPVPEIVPGFGAGAGAMSSTIDDLHIWVEALGSGTLISPELQEERLVTTSLQPGGSFDYGLGIMRLGPFYGHNGAILGFSTFAVYDPELDLTVIVIGNASSNFTAPSTTIAGALITAIDPDLLP